MADKLSGKSVCPVCPRHCALAEGQAGFCRARTAKGGAVACTNYGHITALALDPIEKKPLRHFFPGSHVLSVGSTGCNLRCPFCQNHAISQCAGKVPYRKMAPEALVQQAQDLVPQGNIGLAFTYNEPLVGWEFVCDTAQGIKRHGLKTVLVTAGYTSPGIWARLLPCIDAFNIDLKCFTQKGYQSLGGQLDVVLANIRAAAGAAHVEVTTLVVPGLSDGEEDMARQAEWLAGLNAGIPLHLSRYFPCWQATAPPTPPQTMHRLAALAKRHLKHVYLGNM